MEITSLKCNHCGANLQIKPEIKFFNCSFCGSSLTIKKSGNTIFTEVLGEIKEDTEIIKDNSEVILLEKEIARLDREWLLEREQYKINGGNGIVYYPDENSSHNIYTPVIVIVVMIIGLGMFFSIRTSHMKPPILAFIFPFILLIIFTFQVVLQNGKKEKYNFAKQNYTNKRQDLLKQLEQMKN